MPAQTTKGEPSMIDATQSTFRPRYRTHVLLTAFFFCFAVAGCSEQDTLTPPTTNIPQTSEQASPMTEAHLEHPHLFHLIQEELWHAALESGSVYYPPTYEQDGFTHATANPQLLLNVANHFYTDVPGQWLCLQMTTDSLKAAGVEVVFEGTAPVGDKQPEFSGSEDELFPHILGGIPPAAVENVLAVDRDDTGQFLSVHFNQS